MVNKKSTKRKTRWRTLSIGEGGAAADTDVTIGTSDTRSTQHTYEGRIKHSTTSISGQTYSKHHTGSSGNKLAQTTDSKASFVPSATQPSTRYNYESSRSNYYSRSSDKFSSTHHPQQSGTSGYHGSSTSTYPFKRRPFSSQNSGYASKYYSGSTSNNLHYHRRSSATDSSYTKSTWKANQPTNPESSENKENSTTKPLFNEDDYTRITTPRQDVLFKKGYLSRPKKTTSITTTTDPSSSSSGTMSVVSTEESMTSSMQSFGPEPMDADAFDPLLYPTFYDQNGVFFINPYMSNGFDPYGGQLMMMPYGGGPPFSINPAEYYNNDVQPYLSDELSQKESSIDTPISPTENPINDTEVKDGDDNIATETTENITINDSEPDNEQPADDIAQTNAESSSQDEGVDDTKASNDDSNETTTAEENMCDTPQICPSYYYPYMYGPPPIMPFSLMDMNEGSDNGYFGGTYDNRHNRFKKRKRRPYRAGHSTGVSATTTDYSEDDDFIDNERLHHDEVIPTNGISFFPGLSVAQYNDLIFHTTLNTNVLEFVPRRCAQHPSNTLPDEIVPSLHTVEQTTTSLIVPKSTLNVDVAEFLPRNYIKPSVDVPEIPQNEEPLVDPSLPSEVSADPAKDIDTTIKPKSNHRYRNIPAVAIPDTTTPDMNKPSYSSISANRIIDNRSDKSSVTVVKESPDSAKIAPAKIDQVIMKSDLESKVIESRAKKPEFIFVDRNKKQGNNRNSSSKVSNKSTVKGTVRLSKQTKTDRINSNDKICIVKPDEKPAVQIEQTVQQLPTYAQIIAPIISAINVISSVATVDPPKQIKLEAVITDEIPKIVPKLMQPVQAWHTVKSKGKKKIQPVELSEDFWDEQEPEPTAMPAPKITKPTPKPPVIEPVLEAIVGPTPKAINPKTPKKPKKSKAKKSSKQLATPVDSDIIEPNFVEASVDIINERDDQIDSENLVPIEAIEDSTKEEEFDISEFDFESDPAIFVNAITPSAIYTEQIVDKKMLNSSNGFSLNGSMNFGNCKFDFGSGGKGSSRVLREEEEMVMRAMRSLSFANELKVDLMKPIEIELVSASEELMENVTQFEKLLDETTAIPQDLIESDDENRCRLDVVAEPQAVDGSEINEIKHIEVETVQIERTEEGALQNNSNSFEPAPEAEAEINVQHQKFADLPIESTQNVPNEVIVSENVQEIFVCEEDQLESSAGMKTDSVSSEDFTISMNQNEESTKDSSEVPDDEDHDIINNDNVKTDSSMTDMELVGSSAAAPGDIDIVSADNYDEYDEDSSTVVTQLNGYIEDVMVDPNFDTSVDEDDDDMIIDTVTDGDIEELIKQATKIVQLTNGSTGWMNMTSEPFDSTASMMIEADDKEHQDRIESPRSSEDSGILDNHEDTMNSSEYDSGDCGVAESVTPPADSLTQAVSRWLVQKQKEKSVEPILRLPGDPLLSDSIEKSIQRIQISAMLKSYADDDEYDDDELLTSDESDNEIEMPAPKNSKSNPLHVLSAENRNDQACKRVANVSSKTLDTTPIDALDQPDILEYWENDPMLQQPPTSANKSRVNYAQLLASVGTKTTDDILLSNNSNNNNDNTKLSNKTNNCSSTSQQQLNHKTAPKSSSFNYFKPSEMSCKIM